MNATIENDVKKTDGWWADDGNCPLHYPEAETAEEAASKYAGGGDWNWEDGDKGFVIDIRAWREDEAGGEIESVVIPVTVEPPEPPCTASEHNWQSPHSVLGGLESNPGEHSHGGSVIYTEVCRHCGWYKTTDCWDDRTNLPSRIVSYQEPDIGSEEWIESLNE